MFLIEKIEVRIMMIILIIKIKIKATGQFKNLKEKR